MKYAVEMGSSAMTSIPSCIKICSGIEKLVGGYTDTQRGRRSHKPALGKEDKNLRPILPGVNWI
jgi:hypothetical protein